MVCTEQTFYIDETHPLSFANDCIGFGAILVMNRKYFIFALLCTLLIIYMSSIPSYSIPGNKSLAKKIIYNFAHVPVYAIITILWLKTFRREDSSMLSPATIYILLGLCLFAASDEYHQSFVDGRTASLGDICLDFLGIITGFCMFRYKKSL